MGPLPLDQTAESRNCPEVPGSGTAKVFEVGRQSSPCSGNPLHPPEEMGIVRIELWNPYCESGTEPGDGDRDRTWAGITWHGP